MAELGAPAPASRVVGRVRARVIAGARLLAPTAAVLVVLAAIAVRLTSCAPLPRVAAPPAPASLAQVDDCQPAAWLKAAAINASSLRQLPWSPFGRAEVGWDVYAPLIAREIGARCAPDTPGFARALAAWETRQGFAADGLLSEAAFLKMKAAMQHRRPFVLLSAEGICAAPADPASLAAATPEEGYGGKVVELRPAMLADYRRMVQVARAEAPEIFNDPDSFRLFSGFRSPTYDAARCETEGNCNGVVRAACSPHRTGLAMDLYVGHAPGFAIDSSADENRLAMTRSPAYLWLLANAHRFGFVNYPFEPWHWEWTGEPPRVS